MEHLEGRDLDRIITEDGPLPVDKAVDYMIHAAHALAVAHGQGIVHGDIKPGNLVLDTTGAVRVLNLGPGRSHELNKPFRTSAAHRLAQDDLSVNSVDYMAPELVKDSHCLDHRSDIYSLGCTLHFLLTGREPFPAETISDRMTAHRVREAPSLLASRPDVPRALEVCYQKMMAKRPDDRPGSMSEVIALLQASMLPPEVVGGRVAAPPKSPPEPKVTSEVPPKCAGPAKARHARSIFARRAEREGLAIDHDFNLEDLVTDFPSESPLIPTRPTLTVARPLRRAAMRAYSHQSRFIGAAVIALGAAGLVATFFVGLIVLRPGPAETRKEGPAPPVADLANRESTRPSKPFRRAQPKPQSRTIFDGATGHGWMLCNRAPLPAHNVQPDGLNPHKSGSYLVVYEHKVGDFVLDFDYKLAPGCDSGVFLRVSDLNNPVQTGIEVAIDDGKHGDDRDTGAFRGLVPPRIHAQKPAGQWNHMTITAQGPNLAVSLNATEVSSINVDSWTLPGRRPDGSLHQFRHRAIAQMARTGYLGFQDLGSDCWFKNIVLTSSTDGSRSTPTPPIDP